MGYTHYWTPKVTDEKTWKEFVDTCNTLHKALPKKIKIKGWDGTGKPEFTNELVSFNGDGKIGNDHESFTIGKDKNDWNFCKTARKPYDLLVVAVLIAAHEILGYEISSDGDIDDWKNGIDFYLKTIYDFDGTEDENQLRSILPKFLFDEEKGSDYRKPYSVMDYFKSLFVVVD